MMPTRTHFKSPRLCGFTHEFIDEFGEHKSWQCAVVHPSLSAAYRIEQSDLSWDDRERLTILLARFTRMAMFDRETALSANLVAWPVGISVSYFLPISWAVGRVIAWDLPPYVVLLLVMLLGFTMRLLVGFLVLLAIQWLLRRIINRRRDRVSVEERELTNGAQEYNGRINDANQDLDRLEIFGARCVASYREHFMLVIRLRNMLAKARADYERRQPACAEERRQEEKPDE